MPPLPREVIVDDALDFTLALSPDPNRTLRDADIAQRPTQAVDSYPRLDAILDAAALAWPEQPSKAQRVAVCELGADVGSGAYPASVVFDVERIHGGPMQIARAWAAHFAARWSWSTIVLDLEAHFAAAREIYDRAGGWGPWPVCGLR